MEKVARDTACMAGVKGEGGMSAIRTGLFRIMFTNQKLGHAFFIRVAVFTWELTMFTSHFELLANWNFSA